MIKINSCAVFGGTFDPFHNGHLHLIDSIVRMAKFNKLVIVPAGKPWQKSAVASAEDRLKMVKMALVDREVTISACEIVRSGPSYAIDTLKDIQAEIPAEKYTWILGSDAIAKIQSWHRYSELITHIDFLVVKRPGSNHLDIPNEIRYEEIEIEALDISATEIRAKIDSGESILNLVPGPVAAYIARSGIYGAA